MTSNHLFLFCLILIGVGLSRCNQYRPNKLSQTESTLIELSTRITLLETDNRRVKNELDSLKDRYNQDYYANSNDLDTLFRMAYKGQNAAMDLGKWQRRGERGRAFRKGFLGF